VVRISAWSTLFFSVFAFVLDRPPVSDFVRSAGKVAGGGNYIIFWYVVVWLAVAATLWISRVVYAVRRARRGEGGVVAVVLLLVGGFVGGLVYYFGVVRGADIGAD